MMVIVSEEIEQKRKEFVQLIFDKIRNVPNYSNLHTNINCVFASLGLLFKAKEERFFEHGDWYNFECREELLSKVDTFLKKKNIQ